MSRPISHDRLKNRIKGEQGHSDELEYQLNNMYRRDPGIWVRMDFGPLIGLTAPEAFFADLPRFNDTLRDYCMDGKLAHTQAAIQARHVANCACNILPQGSREGSHSFLLFKDLEGRFAHALPIKKAGLIDPSLLTHMTLVDRVDVLDATYPYDCYDPRNGLKNMARVIETQYLEPDKPWKHRRAELFFQNPSNFALSRQIVEEGIANGIFYARRRR